MSHCCSGSNGSNGSNHDHDHESSEERGFQYSLYQKIDLDNLRCLNESVENSGRNVFKPWEERLNFEKIVESDADEELLFDIPFTANVKLKGIIVVGEDSDSHPSHLRIYKNRPNMTFDETSAPPDQEFKLQKDPAGNVEYPIKVVKFSSVTQLVLHFPKNFGADATKICYVGLRGEFSPAHRHGVTICSYETKPNVADHQTESFNQANNVIQ